MSAMAIGFGGLIALLGLLLIRIPIGLAMIGVSGAGLWVLYGQAPAWGVLSDLPHDFIASWTLSAIPMFLLMGYVSYHAGLTQSLFALARALLGRIPGSLGIASVAACSGFAAVCGSSIACAAAMGRIAIPEMVRAGYSPAFAGSTVAAGGTIGALIPPSIVLILFGIFAQVSIVGLFLGGFIIGVISAVAYTLLILVMSWVRPDVVPRSVERPAPGEVRRQLWEVAPILIIIVGVFGGLFSGFFTTTEAGAVGAFLSIVVALAKRRLSRSLMLTALTKTVAACGSLFIVGIGAIMFTAFLSLSGLQSLISGAVTGAGLEYFQVMLIVVVVYLLLGTFLEPVGAMLITIPIFVPVMQAMGVELIFFGVLVAKLVEVGMITPPMGMNVFVIRGVVGDSVSLMRIFRSVALFVLADICVVALMICAPWIIPGVGG